MRLSVDHLPPSPPQKPHQEALISQPYSTQAGSPTRTTFGHAPKPQPKDTTEWVKTFALDLFKPHKIIPKQPNPNDPPDPLADKNLLQKVALWFQTMAQGFLEDLKLAWQRCRLAVTPK